jgi:hypothetical protein
MTAARTFPSDATDQLVQANIVAARYAALRAQFGAGIGSCQPARTSGLHARLLAGNRSNLHEHHGRAR